MQADKSIGETNLTDIFLPHLLENSSWTGYFCKIKPHWGYNTCFDIKINFFVLGIGPMWWIAAVAVLHTKTFKFFWDVSAGVFTCFCCYYGCNQSGDDIGWSKKHSGHCCSFVLYGIKMVVSIHLQKLPLPWL